MANRITKIIVKGRKEKSVMLSCICGKINPTAKLPVQFTKVAMAIAAERGAENEKMNKFSGLLALLFNIYLE